MINEIKERSERYTTSSGFKDIGEWMHVELQIPNTFDYKEHHQHARIFLDPILEGRAIYHFFVIKGGLYSSLGARMTVGLERIAT